MPIIILDPQPRQPIEDYVEHDLPLLVKEKPKTLSWEDHKLVIIGTDSRRTRKVRKDSNFQSSSLGPLNEVDACEKQLKRLGFDVFVEGAYPWSRNSFLSFDDFLVGSTDYDGELTNGGVYVFGRDFVMVSNSLVRNYNRDGFIYTRTTTNEKTVRKFWEIFGIEKVYFVPPANKTPNTAFSHPDMWEEVGADLDYTMNSIPWLDIYTVDQEHYREQKDIFRRIEKENGIEFTRIKPTVIVRPSIRDMKNHKIDLWDNQYFVAVKEEKHGRIIYIIYNYLTRSVDDVIGEIRRQRKIYDIECRETIVPLIKYLL